MINEILIIQKAINQVTLKLQSATTQDEKNTYIQELQQLNSVLQELVEKGGNA